MSSKIFIFSGYILPTETTISLGYSPHLPHICKRNFGLVDSQGGVKVRTNSDSVPVKAGTRVQVKVWPADVEIWQQGRCVARHERCYGRRQEILDLEHYLEVVEQKPGALSAPQ